ncbi:small integral membrane protein 1 isoform X2 [Octodon degus]|uniref:Small integral membrane protein 1 isoform X2 n=1 Tax=Octodon degus TaxID=10160 RepID=A0A6P6D5J5_OCTDE|nr:small integral membrane protein 1 isoform X2 [Octodon degus]
MESLESRVHYNRWEDSSQEEVRVAGAVSSTEASCCRKTQDMPRVVCGSPETQLGSSCRTPQVGLAATALCLGPSSPGHTGCHPPTQGPRSEAAPGPVSSSCEETPNVGSCFARDRPCHTTCLQDIPLPPSALHGSNACV